MFKKILYTSLLLLSYTSNVISNQFKFILKENRTLSDPVHIFSKEKFNIEYIPSFKNKYTFILTKNNKVILKNTELLKPYYLYGNNKNKINYNSLNVIGDYILKIKENKHTIKFKVIDNIPSTSTIVPSTPSTIVPSTPSTNTTNINISYCTKNFPINFNNLNDHISLHYDMSYDPDDYISAVADRVILETKYGTNFLKNQTTRVIGTCGGSCSGYNTPANKLMQYTYGDVGNYEITIAANDPIKYSKAMNYELSFYKSTILRGGRIFVKEGGESDFTKKIVEELEKWFLGSGKCVYIVQHSITNENNNGKGVLSYIKSKTNYIKISDGNIPYRKSNWRLNGKSFDFYALQTKWECAWQFAFDEFKKKRSYCPGLSGNQPIQKCVDFSDTHELLYIINENTLGIDNFVNKYLTLSSDKLKCI